MIHLDHESELSILGRWLTGHDREDIELLDRRIFTNCKKLYKHIAAGASWEQIPEDAKAEIASDTPRTDLYELADGFLYSQARYSALKVQRSLLAEALNDATGDERQYLYYQIDDISDLLEGKDRAPIAKNSAGAFLDSFLSGKALTDTPCIETHFKKLDEALDGGLYPGLYVMGAISSMGKTSLMLQLADQIATAGTDVLYFTLEMGAHELIAKSLSRYSFIEAGKEDRGAATARSITRHRLDTLQAANVDKAIEVYRSETTPHLWFFESLGDIGLKDVRREVEKHQRATGNSAVVFIDYLQIIRPYNEFWTEKRNVDKIITDLRKLSRDYKTPVFCISSLNRGSYKGDIELESFKESGGVEYGSDVLLGLQVPGLEDGATPKEAKANKQAVEDEKRKVERALEIKILKNRSGATGQRIRLTFNAKFGYFSDEGSDIPAGWTHAGGVQNPWNR